MLYGKRIKLIPLEKEDLSKSRSWVNDKSLNSRILRVMPVTQSDQERWYQEIVQDASKLVFAIKTLTEEEHIGNTGFYHIDWIHRRAEFWILIGERDFWKKQIGKEVVSLMQHYAFENLNLNKLHLNVGSDNREAIGLYKKSGFIQEGVLKAHYFIEGRYRDIITMAILRNDFYAQK